jgi:hypothetical protein
MTLMAFPFKVPNRCKVGSRTLPDLAELAAIRQLRKLREAIEAVYPPAMELHLLHDGSLICDVFAVPVEEVRRYEAYLTSLIEAEDVGSWFHCHDFVSVQSQVDLRPQALGGLRDEAERWWRGSRDTAEWRASFRKTLGMLNIRSLADEAALELMMAAGSGKLPPEWADLEGQVHEAMIGYYVLDAVIHRFDPRPVRFHDAVHCTSQERPGRLSIWLVRRGQSLLPWHGVGIVDARGRLGVELAHRVAGRGCRKPIYLANEDTPFGYCPPGFDAQSLKLPNRVLS